MAKGSKREVEENAACIMWGERDLETVKLSIFNCGHSHKF